ncbi:MAG: class I SAM-dependent rRNA methyltransferase [Spirochaetales bacterium]|nr:class I SAM-dependent rRNA methyltransferase [Spirochaetales bacterium]
MNTHPAALHIRKGRDESVHRRHPWIFSGAVQRVEGSPANGDVVSVYDHRGAFLCKGHFQDATIKVRILSYRDEPIDTAFYHSRLAAAIDHRRSMDLPGEATDMYRLVHGDGDLLPGLIIDCYSGVFVIQAHSAGMTKDAGLVCDALKSLFGNDCRAVYLKTAERGTSSTGRYLYTAPESDPGKLAAGSMCREHGYRFHVDWEAGQKTGFFLDQRENRRLVGSFSGDKRVLNLFCYTGGFSVYALGSGAAEVVSVDSSARAMELTGENISLLGKTAGSHRPVCADVMSVLKETADPYDVVVLDPPAFAKHVKARHNAIQGYKRLNFAALPRVKPGGLLFTFSCSQVVTQELFEGAVRAAAIDSGRHIQILRRLGHPGDHPVSLFHPEGEYLKGLMLKVY